MRTRSKLILAGLTAAILLSFAVGSASANRLSISTRNVRVVWSNLQLEGGGSRIICPVTLEGSFHSSTITKTAGLLIGHISRASVIGSTPPCTGGHATVLRETLPWHVTYESFAGTLPRPSRINIQLIGASFQVDQPTTCLARTTTTSPAKGSVEVEANGLVIGLSPDP